MKHNDISGEIIDAAMLIHRELGPGLLESAYLAILAAELTERRFAVKTEVPIPVRWKGETLDVGFRADMVVESKVIVELKSVERVAPVHHKQLLTYLRVADKRLGLLINFGAPYLKDGIFRAVNGLEE